MFFTDRGRAYQLRCYEIPEAGRMARGTAIVNLLPIEGGEKVTAMLPVPEEKVAGHYLVMATRMGLIKRTELKDFENLRRSGLIAIVLREEDELIGVALTDGTRDVLLGTRGGMAIRFSETDVRVMGRVSMGVKSIELAEGDEVVAMSIVEEGALHHPQRLWQAHGNRRVPRAVARGQGHQGHEPHGKDGSARRPTAGGRR